jgi:hypothetical protein
MASAAASMRVSLPSPRGGMRHAFPSPMSPRLKPPTLNLPKEDPFSFVVRAARVSRPPNGPRARRQGHHEIKGWEGDSRCTQLR